MSVVVAIGFDDFSVVGTDTCRSYENGLRFEAIKLYAFGDRGWGAGVGLTGITDTVMMLLLQDRGNIEGRIQRAWQAREDLGTHWKQAQPDLDDLLERSVAVATLPLTSRNGSRFVLFMRERARPCISRCVVLSGSLVREFGVPPCAQSAPTGPLPRRLGRTVRDVAAYIHSVSQMRKGVSDTADIGVSLAEPIDGRRVRLRYTGNAQAIALASDEELPEHLSPGSWHRPPPGTAEPGWVRGRLFPRWWWP